MVKKVVLLTFLFGIFILCNILFESAKLVKIEKIELDYENINLGYMNSKRTLDLHDIYNNKLYLSVLDFNKENLGITKSILIYDLSLINFITLWLFILTFKTILSFKNLKSNNSSFPFAWYIVEKDFVIELYILNLFSIDIK